MRTLSISLAASRCAIGSHDVIESGFGPNLGQHPDRGYQAEVFSVVCLGTIVADMRLYKPRNRNACASTDAGGTQVRLGSSRNVLKLK